jgi:hypothetical protein
MCAYARETLTGAIDRDYCERDARRFAQAALIPEELLEREHINTAQAAATLAIPTYELADALTAAKAPRDTSRVDDHVYPPPA